MYKIRYGLVVRIAGSHPAGPGSIPGNGILFLAVQFGNKSEVHDEVEMKQVFWLRVRLLLYQLATSRIQ